MCQTSQKFIDKDTATWWAMFRQFIIGMKMHIVAEDRINQIIKDITTQNPAVISEGFPSCIIFLSFWLIFEELICNPVRAHLDNVSFQIGLYSVKSVICGIFSSLVISYEVHSGVSCNSVYKMLFSWYWLSHFHLCCPCLNYHR